MAKGNLFLGDAKGSVGSVTFYRKNGQQISRQRVRTVRNPSTQGQLIQRAVTATVVRAYQAGLAIFDHSFQGRLFGADNQALFMKRNMVALRELAVAELDAGTTAADGRAVVIARGSVFPVPWTYRISEGTLFQDLFSIAPSSGDANMLEATLPAAGSATTLGEYCAAHQLVDEDIFTVVGFGIRASSGWSASDPGATFRNWESGFGFIRLKVKDTAIASATAIGTATLGDLFEVNSEGAAALDLSQLLTAAIPLSTVVATAVTGTMGVIRSRDNSVERSTCDMTAPVALKWGVKMPYLFGAWNPKSETAGQSDRILEGGGF